MGTVAGELELRIMGTVADELEFSVIILAFESGAADDCDDSRCSVVGSLRLVVGALLEEDGVIRGCPFLFPLH